MNSNKPAEKFVLQFFQQVDHILAEKSRKGGGKRKGKSCKNPHKKQKGGMKPDNDITPDLPVPLSASNQSNVAELQEELNTNSEFKQGFRIKVVSSPAAAASASASATETQTINDLFGQHISAVLRNISTTNALELTPQELQVLALYYEFKKVHTKASEGAEIVLKQIAELPGKEIVQDDKSEENIQRMSSVLQHVEGPRDLVDRQISVVERITNTAVDNMRQLMTLYERNASPQEISKRLIGTFMNLMGNLAALFNMLACFSNRISNNMTSLMRNNPVIYFLMKLIQTCISFVVYLLNYLFLMLTNTFIGKSCLIILFLYYYRQNNPIAIFLANCILKILKIVDSYVGISDYAIQCFLAIQQQLLDYLPQLLTNAALTTFVNSVITSALSSPEVMNNFIRSLAPEITRQLIGQSLPSLSQALASEITPQLIEGVSSSVVETMMPQLINGVTQTMITDVAPQLATQVATQVATQAAITSAQSTFFTAASSTLSKVAINAATSIIAGSLGIDQNTIQPVAGYLTSGGKKTKKHRRYKKYTSRR